MSKPAFVRTIDYYTASQVLHDRALYAVEQITKELYDPIIMLSWARGATTAAEASPALFWFFQERCAYDEERELLDEETKSIWDGDPSYSPIPEVCRCFMEDAKQRASMEFLQCGFTSAANSILRRSTIAWDLWDEDELPENLQWNNRQIQTEENEDE